MAQQGPHLLCVAAPWGWDGVSKREEGRDPVPRSPERSPGRRLIHRGPAKGPMTSRPEGGLGLEKPGVLGGQPEPPKLLAHRDVAPLRRHLSKCPSTSSGLGGTTSVTPPLQPGVRGAGGASACRGWEWGGRMAGGAAGACPHLWLPGGDPGLGAEVFPEDVRSYDPRSGGGRGARASVSAGAEFGRKEYGIPTAGARGGRCVASHSPPPSPRFADIWRHLPFGVGQSSK